MDPARRSRLSSGLAIATLIIASSCGVDADKAPAPVAAALPATTVPTSVPRSSVASISTTLEPPQVMKVSEIDYADSKSLDVYAPTSPGPWPVAVVVHGLGQSRSEFASLAEAIAAEGMVVFNISVTFSVPPLDAIEDIACAVRFARAKAPDYGGDPTSISIVGNSSGAAKGSIVAMDGDAYDSSDCVVTEGSALPNALIGYEGPYDYATHLYGSFNVPRLQNEDPEVWEAVNPYSHIGGNDGLLVRLIHGRDKDVAWYDVLPEVSAAFGDALAETGYDVELAYVDGASHGALRPGTEAFEVTVQKVLNTVGG